MFARIQVVRSRRECRGLWSLAVAVVASAGSAALAQDQNRGFAGVPARAPAAAPSIGAARSQGAAPASGLGGVRSQGAAPMSALGGVRAQAPRPLSGINPPKAALPGPISGLGGVRASFPQTQPLGPSLRQPEFKPLQVAPWPGRPTGGPVTTERGTIIGNGSTVPRAISAAEFPSVIVPRDSNGALQVEGAFVGDREKLGLHIGLNPKCLVIPRCRSGFGFPIIAGGWWWNGDASYANYGTDYGTIPGYYTQMDPSLMAPQAQPTVPAETHPADDRDRGDVYLKIGDVKSAVMAYRSHLKAHPDDAGTMRVLGLALIAESQIKEGVAMIGMAYRTSPALADSPVSPDIFRGGAEQFRETLRRVSVYANRSGTAAAWLTVAMFMQAEGRTENARTMLDRASSAGLEPDVAAAMRTNLSH